ncbi:MAG: hypothetical protein CMO11_00540 [Thaumarchaeota archaeon]|nr:hypothetical protein [Nitrososphaerota archaeon]|tara:strand:+ start:739 stop:1359 length:621 start_codon:yes stop_codon:yes gene_type:complete
MKTKEEMIHELLKIKIPYGLIEYIAKKERSSLGEGMINSLKKMNDGAVRSLHSSLVEGNKGRNEFLLLRSAQWICKQLNTTNIVIENQIANIGDFNIVAREEDEIICVAECINDNLNFEAVNDFVEKIRKLKNNQPKLSQVYYISSIEFNEDLLNNIKNIQGMSVDGIFTAEEKKGLAGMFNRKSTKLKFEFYHEIGILQYKKFFP